MVLTADCLGRFLQTSPTDSDISSFGQDTTRTKVFLTPARQAKHWDQNDISLSNGLGVPQILVHSLSLVATEEEMHPCFKNNTEKETNCSIPKHKPHKLSGVITYGPNLIKQSQNLKNK